MALAETTNLSVPRAGAIGLLGAVRRRPALSATIGFGVAMAAYAALLQFRPGSPTTTSLLMDLFSNAAAGTATVLAVLAAARSTARDRLAWCFIAAGLGIWTLGDLVWASYGLAGISPPPYPGIPDIGYLGMVPAMVIGIAKLNGGAVWQQRTRRLFEPMPVILALMAVIWHFVMLPVFRDAEAPVFERIVSCAYPAAEIVLLSAAVMSLWGNRRGPNSRVLAVLTLAIAVNLAADTFYTFLALHESFYQGHLVDYGWMAALLLFGLSGALQAIGHPAAVAVPSGQRLPAAAKMSLPLILIPLAIAFAVTLSYYGMLAEDPALAVLILFIGAAVTVEPALVIIDNARLNRRLAQARDELEERVLSRTAEATKSEAKFRLLNESSTDAMVVTDEFGMVVSWNPAATRLFGLASEDIVGFNFFERLPHTPRLGATERLWDWRRLAQVAPGSAPIEVVGTRSDGRPVPLEVSLSSWVSEDGLFHGAVMRDISERRRYEEQLRFLAEADFLTGLYNRRRLDRELERELARLSLGNARGALLVIDLDHFKGVNDSLGHRSGDDLLVSVSGLLRSSVGPEAVVARLGGDEFAILVPDIDGPAALSLGATLIDAISGQRVVIRDVSIAVTASIGIALYPEHATTSAELQVRADNAMYRAKELRNRVWLYSPQPNDSGMSLQRPWEQQIRDALEHSTFELEFQPICNGAGTITQHEALIRLRGEDGQLIPPSAFLGTAERSGLIHAIDRWVVAKVISIIAAENAAGRELRIEVNLSAMAFGDPHLLPEIERLLAESGIAPSQLVFEITETAAIADLEEARAFIQELKDLGCLFALDDFGTGFSSLSLLKQLPVDYLKIDGSFIRNLATDPTDRELVRAISQMARALGKETIAEFVSDAESVVLLRELGVDYVQGHYVGRPSGQLFFGSRVSAAAA